MYETKRSGVAVTGITLLLALLAIAPPGAGASDGASHALEQLVASKATALQILHTKAKRALVTAAQDRTFADFAALGAGDDAPARHQHLRQRVDAISLAVQSRFQVEEMCLIGPDGAELSRVVGGQVATDLSPDETGAAFFAPGFASPVRQVHVSGIYLSPDADKWVVAYVTPVHDSDRTAAILHYEHSLAGYQQVLRRGLAADAPLLLLLSEDGYIIGHSHEDIALDRVGERESPSDYFARFTLGGADLAAVLARLDRGELVVGEDGRRWRGAYRRVERWTVLGLL